MIKISIETPDVTIRPFDNVRIEVKNNFCSEKQLDVWDDTCTALKKVGFLELNEGEPNEVIFYGSIWSLSEFLTDEVKKKVCIGRRSETK